MGDFITSLKDKYKAVADFVYDYRGRACLVVGFIIGTYF